MASSSLLSQFQSVKKSCDRLIVAIEDVNDLWKIVKEGFEARIPLRKACLNNKAHSQITVDSLPVEYVLTTDSRLRSRMPQEQSLFWFLQPFAVVVLVSCQDLDEYKSVLKPRLRLITQNEDREWLIVFVSKAHLSTDQAGKLTRKIYNKIEVDFSSRRRERCCKLDMHVADAAVWEDVESKMVECIRYTLDRRTQFYEEEIRRLSENRFMQGWSFCNFFIMKESLAYMFEMAQMYEDAVCEYDELEQCFMELVDSANMRHKEFGGLDVGDDRASLLDSSRKPLTHMAQLDSFKDFDFKQYLFARQSLLLFKLNRPFDVAARGHSFIISFSKALAKYENNIPFGLKEVWVISACLELIKESMKTFNPKLVTADSEKEFYCLQADFYSLARIKLMRLADLIGHGTNIERSPCNSAALSMLPWPKPRVWPSVPIDGVSQNMDKEQVLEERQKPVGISKKLLSLAPTSLLREANRRRASLSFGNSSEVLESRHSSNDSPAGDTVILTSPPLSVPTSPPQTKSIPQASVSPSSTKTIIDRPMRLPEIQAAADHALKKTITEEKMRKALSSSEEFEAMYIELTRAAADNYHRCFRKRHGVVLDGEVAAWHLKCGNYDSAAKLYEKVCALYSAERWHGLLAQVLPHLAQCQKQLGDLAGYLLSCVKLLALDRGLLLDPEKLAVQSELVSLAHSALNEPVFLDVSPLVTFSGGGGTPLELCEGDPGTLPVLVWSSFPGDISLDAFSVTLIAANTPDDGAKVVQSTEPPILKPGKNNIFMVLPSQQPGMYALGVLTGQLGNVRLRSNAYCATSAITSKGGSPESNDYLSLEKRPRPVLQVSKQRPLVEITLVVSWGLLMGEPQWLGLKIKPLDYSVNGAVLHLSPGSGFCFENNLCEVECQTTESGYREKESLSFKEGKLKLPDWVVTQALVLWFQVRAIQEKQDTSSAAFVQYSPLSESNAEESFGNGTNDSTIHTQKSNGNVYTPKETEPHLRNNSDSTGIRKIDVRLQFGASHNRLFERTLTVQFLEPLRVITRIVARGNETTLLLQVNMISQLNASITIVDARLKLQQGYKHAGDADGGPLPSSILPFLIAPAAESALLFRVCLDSSSTPKASPAPEQGCEAEERSVLSIDYKIAGERDVGAHYCSSAHSNLLHFKCNLSLQQQMIHDPILGLGMLPLPIENLRVGQQFVLRWRLHRLKQGLSNPMRKGESARGESQNQEMEELLYEIDVNPDDWMIAGRKKGHTLLSLQADSKVVISSVCLPLVAGYVRPPSLALCNVDRMRISCTPAGPHYFCVLPPLLSSTYCIHQRH